MRAKRAAVESTSDAITNSASIRLDEDACPNSQLSKPASDMRGWGEKLWTEGPDVPPPQPESVPDTRTMLKSTSRPTIKI